MVNFCIVVVSCLVAGSLSQQCVYKANNTENRILNLTALNGTIITASDGVFGYAYDPCNNDMLHCGSDLVSLLSLAAPSTCYAVPNSVPVKNVEFIPSADYGYSYKITYNALGATWAIIYWYCDFQTDEYRLIDSGTFGTLSNSYHTPQIQLKLATQYACNVDGFSLKGVLKDMDLSKYYESFINEGFKDNDYKLISKLSDGALKDLGVNKMADRYRILSHFHP